MVQCYIYYSQYVAVTSQKRKLEQNFKPPSNIESFHLQYKYGSFAVFNVSDVPLSR